MINLSQPITGRQILYFIVGAVTTIVTLVVITYAISWAWKKRSRIKQT